MKKVKIMFSAIAILAIVGGALAFKAKTYSGGNVYTIKNITGYCTVLSTQLTKDESTTPEDRITGFTTNNQQCPDNFPVKFVQ